MHSNTLSQTPANPYINSTLIGPSDLPAYGLFLKQETIPDRPLQQLIGEPADIDDFDPVYGWVL